MSHRRKLKDEPSCVDCLACLPYRGTMDLIIQKIFDTPSMVLSSVEIPGKGTFIVVVADRAAAVSATAEGAAGLHKVIDSEISAYGDAERSDFKG